MTNELWIFIISIIASLIILKKSFDWDALSWGILAVVGLFGFLFFGFFGLIGSLIFGVILNFFLGSISWVVMRLFDVGLVKRKNRELIAKGFIAEHKKEIFEQFKKHDGVMDLARRAGFFSNLSEKQIGDSSREFGEMYSEKTLIDAYSGYINEIFAEANKLENPVKRHRWDTGSAGLRENFVRGGQKWIEKPFMDSRPPFPSSGPETTGIKRKFVEFCENVIFDNPERVGIVRNH
ncbi:MAG: hypothetical protein QG579_447 [Patescibacteria group bacterium]|nr:hypothetical protein [Patescibacteria group bacterium]MDQ5969290.1 hypothetical protein [Patescibacteria group bacterium]